MPSDFCLLHLRTTGRKSRMGQSPSLPDKRRNEPRRCGSFLGAEAQKIEDEHDDEDDSLISGSGLNLINSRSGQDV